MAATSRLVSRAPADGPGQRREAAVLLTAACIVPFLVHAVPSGGPVPLGARLLPLFWVAFLGAFFLRPRVAVGLVLAGAVFNGLVSGRPTLEVFGPLVLELVVFTTAVGWAVRRDPGFPFWAPLAYVAAAIIALPAVGLLGPGLEHATPLVVAGLANAWPGLACLFALNLVVARLRLPHAVL